MKKLILILTLIITGICVANDGSFTKYAMLYGNVYSKSEHPFIGIEKEFIDITHPINKKPSNWKTTHSLNYKIHYSFKNHSDKELLINAAFPVKLSFSLYIFKSESKPYFYTYSKETNFKDENELYNTIFRLGHKAPYHYQNKTQKKQEVDIDGGGPEYHSSISKKNFTKVKSIEYNKLISYQQFKSKFKNLIPFAIYQNGKKLKIEKVMLVLKINTKPIDRYEYRAKFTVHFIHKLSFKANEESKVFVKYKAHTITEGLGAGAGYGHINYYILGTGRTWRGPIKELLIKAPYYLLPDLPKKFKKVQTKNQKFNYYFAKDYEPKINDMIELRYNSYSNYIVHDKEFKTGGYLYLSDFGSNSRYYIKRDGKKLEINRIDQKNNKTVKFFNINNKGQDFNQIFKAIRNKKLSLVEYDLRKAQRIKLNKIDAELNSLLNKLNELIKQLEILKKNPLELEKKMNAISKELKAIQSRRYEIYYTFGSNADKMYQVNMKIKAIEQKIKKIYVKFNIKNTQNEKKLKQNSNPTSKKELQAKKAASVKKSKNAASQTNEMSPYILYGAFLLIGMLIVFLFLLKKRSSHK